MVQYILRVFILSFLFFQCASSKYEKMEKLPGSLPTSDMEKYRKAQDHITTGKIQFSRNDFDRSLEEADKALALAPLPEAHYLKGNNLQKLGRFREANDSFRSANEAAPESEQILLAYAVSSATVGDHEKAGTLYAKLLEKHPDDPVYLFQAAMAAKNSRKNDEALKLFQSAESKGYKPVESVWLQMAEIHASENRNKEAEEYFAKAGKNQKSGWADDYRGITGLKNRLNEGKELLRAGKYEEAHAKFTEALKTDPKIAASWLLAGLASYGAEKFSDAEKEFNNATDLDGTLEDAWVYRIRTARKLDKQEEAAKLSDQGLQAVDKSAKLHYEKGQMRQDKGDIPGATASYLQSVNLSRSFLPPLSRLTEIYCNSDRFQDAEKLLQNTEVAEADRKDLNEYVKLKKLNHDLENLYGSRKIADMEKLIRQHSDLAQKPDVLYWQARICLKKKPGKLSCLDSLESTEESKNHLPSIRLQKETLEKSAGTKRQNHADRIAALNEREKKQLSKGGFADLYEALEAERKGEFEKAAAIYEKRLVASPNDSALKGRLAHCYLQTAVRLAGAVKKKNEKTAERKSGKKRKQKKKKKSPAADSAHVKALALVDKAAALVPDSPEPAEIRLVLEENRQMKELSGQVKKAIAAEKKENFSEAAGAWKSVYEKIRSPLVFYRLWKAVFRISGSGPAEAEDLLHREQGQLEKHPGFPLVMGQILAERGEKIKAEKVFREYLATHPENAEVRLRLGLLYLQNGEAEKSLVYFRQASEFDPEMDTARVGEGVALHKSSRRKEAKSVFEELTGRENHDAMAEYNLAIINLNEEAYREARKYFNGLTRLKEYKAEADYYLGFIDYLENDLAAAEKNLKNAISQSPEQLYLYGLAKTYEKSGKSGEKAAVIAQLSSLYPGGYYTEKLLRSTGSSRESSAATNFISAGTVNWMRKPVSDFFIINNSIFYLETDSLVRYDLSGGSEKWRKPLSMKVKAMEAGPFLYLLFSDHIQIRDAESGEKIRELPLGTGGARSLQKKGDTLIIGYPDGDRAMDISGTEKVPKVAGRRLLIGGEKIFAYKPGGGSLDEVCMMNCGKFSLKPGANIFSVSEAPNGMVLVSTDKSVLVLNFADGRWNQTAEYPLQKVSEAGVTGTGVFVFSGSEVSLFTTDKTEKFPVPAEKNRKWNYLHAASKGEILISDGKEFLVRDGKSWKPLIYPVKTGSYRDLILLQSQ